jgi:hypothetical protein
MNNFTKLIVCLIIFTTITACKKNISSNSTTPQSLIIGAWSIDSTVITNIDSPFTQIVNQINTMNYRNNMNFVSNKAVYVFPVNGTNYDTLQYYFKNDSTICLVNNLGAGLIDTTQYSIITLLTKKMVLFNEIQSSIGNKAPYETTLFYTYFHKLQ